MNKRDLADRFSGDVDNLLNELGVTDQEPVSKEYEEMIELSRQLATADFSRQSRVRRSLRRRLLSRPNNALVTAVDIPGPWGMIKRFFKLGESYEYRPLQRGWLSKNSLIAASLGVVMFAIIVVSPIGKQLGQQALTLSSQFFPEQPGLTIDDSTPISLITRWQYRAEGGISSAPAVSQGRLYAGSNSGALYALDSRTGRELWRFQMQAGIEAKPTVANGMVYAGSRDGYLYAVDVDTGQERWHFKTGDGIYASPVVAGETIYVGSDDHYLYAIEGNTGQEKWRFETGGPVTSSPFISGSTLYVGSKDWNLYALDTKTGQEIWRFKTEDWVQSSPIVQDGVVYVGSHDENLYAIDAETGRQIWRYFVDYGVISSPALANGVVYVGSYDGHLYAVDVETGQERWRFKTGKPTQSSPVVEGGTVYFGSGDGYLYAVDARTGQERARIQGDSQIYRSPVIVEQTTNTQAVEKYVYFVSEKGNLYAVENVPLLPDQSEETDAVSLDGTSDSGQALGFQFTPSGWYASEGSDSVRFRGQIIDGAGEPVNGFSVQADNGAEKFLSEPSGPNHWLPDRNDGAWEIVVPDTGQENQWWWLTLVRDECLQAGADFNAHCENVTALSESIKVEVIYPDETAINADWVCHRECENR